MATRSKAGKTWTWKDCVDPTPTELEELAAEFGVPASLLNTCMDPEHLPKYEQLESFAFIVLRSLDLEPGEKSDTIQGLTRKLAIFVRADTLITIHRKPQRFIEDRWAQSSDKTKTTDDLVIGLINDVVRTYDPGVSEAFHRFEDFEQSVFNESSTIDVFPYYSLKRRVSIIHRMLSLLLEPIEELQLKMGVRLAPRLNSALQLTNRLLFQADEIKDNLESLLSLQLSLASFKTNEVMRVLTIFSVVIMPLNFIASIYGMNFEHMPELKQVLGYPVTLITMALTALAILYWFKRRGWLKGP